jgi:flagellar basal body-associated protein FliL
MEEQNLQQTTAKGSKWWIWIILILVLVGVGIGLYLWLSGDAGFVANSGGSALQPPSLPD